MDLRIAHQEPPAWLTAYIEQAEGILCPYRERLEAAIGEWKSLPDDERGDRNDGHARYLLRAIKQAEVDFHNARDYLYQPVVRYYETEPGPVIVIAERTP